MDHALENSKTSLVVVLRDYVRCCRRDADSLTHLLAELDRLAGSDGFVRRYRQFSSEPGFPSFQGVVGSG